MPTWDLSPERGRGLAWVPMVAAWSRLVFRLGFGVQSYRFRIQGLGVGVARILAVGA